MQGYVRTYKEAAIGRIEFYHPASNACDPEMLDKMVAAFNSFSKDIGVKIILLTAKGDRAFCAGASIKHLAALADIDAATEFFKGFAHLILAMKQCDKIVITGVQGRAVGGGVGIIAASDFVIATEKSGVRLSELKIGIAPLVIAPAVIRKVGLAGFTNLSLQPKLWQNAQWAATHGLFNTVVPQEGYKAALDAFTKELQSYSSQALLEIKKALWQDTAHWNSLLFNNAALTAALSLSKPAQNAFKEFNT